MKTWPTIPSSSSVVAGHYGARKLGEYENICYRKDERERRKSGRN